MTNIIAGIIRRRPRKLAPVSGNITGAAFAVALRIKKGAALPRFRIDGQIGPLAGSLGFEEVG